MNIEINPILLDRRAAGDINCTTAINLMPIKVSIVEDDRDTRADLVALVSGQANLICLSAYPNAEAALHGIPAEKPDVAIVDINLPGMSGIECVAELKIKMPALQILMLTMYEESDLIFNALRAGASGYLLKKTDSAELIGAIEQVHTGGAPMSVQIARKVINYFQQIKKPASETKNLTPRELEVLSLLAKGFLYKEISSKLDITINTLRNHLRSIYEKLHVHSRTEATLKFLGR